jgi:hypothetical protein
VSASSQSRSFNYPSSSVPLPSVSSHEQAGSLPVRALESSVEYEFIKW